MYNELIITTSNQKHRAFFMNGFFTASQPTSNLHKHNFAEIHLIIGGNAIFRIGNELYPLNDGSMRRFSLLHKMRQGCYTQRLSG